MSRGPLTTHEIFYPADEVLKARNIIFMTGSVLKKLALLVKTEHNMQNISDIIAYHVPVFTCALFLMSNSCLIHGVACLCTGPQHFPKRVFQRLRFSASRIQCLRFCLKHRSPTRGPQVCIMRSAATCENTKSTQ
jgi:hypothetical protein